MRVVITGPTGAVGHALIEVCIENRVEVLAICHKGSKRIKTLPASEYVKVLELDLDEYESISDIALADYGTYDVFYHFAWNGTIGDVRNNMQIQHQNIGYALSAVHLAKRLGCHTFIGAGSQAEYGRVDGVLCPNTPTFPENGYGIAKLCAGQMTRIECQKLEIKHIWMRILSIYGPYDGEKTMITSTIRKLLAGEVPEFTKGEQLWDYLYSKDAGRAMLLLGQKGVDGRIYPIGSGKTKPLHEYIELMRDAIDPDLLLAIGAIPYAPKQVMHLCADISQLTEDTGFVPKISFEEGIKETIHFIMNYYKWGI